MTPDERVHLAQTNLRELGGYPTADGRRIKAGLLYRCGHMAELDDAATATYQGLGLTTIIDLRREDEVDNQPTPQFGAETNHHISVSTGDNSFAAAAAMIDDPEKAGDILATAADYYRAIVTTRLANYRPVFDLVLDPAAHPLLFHCTAGKDRTGFVAAATLKWLGVEDDIVMGDYLLTNTVRGPMVEERIDFHRNRIATERGVDPSEVSETALGGLRALLLTDPSFLQATFDAVTDTYGDWHTMRRDALDISDDRLEAFSDAVLE